MVAKGAALKGLLVKKCGAMMGRSRGAVVTCRDSYDAAMLAFITT